MSTLADGQIFALTAPRVFLGRRRLVAQTPSARIRSSPVEKQHSSVLRAFPLGITRKYSSESLCGVIAI